MPRQAGALYAALIALEDRARAARRAAGLMYSRRETERALRKEPYNADLDSRRISTWLPQDPRGAQVPRADGDRVWALVRLWSAWAGDTPPHERYWRDLIEAAQPLRITRGQGAEVGRPIGEFRDPFTLEVHRCIDVDQAVSPDLGVLPEYVPREHDRLLTAAVAKSAAGNSTLVVLVGGSSTGKTRACWEAVHALPQGWRLWHPIDPGRPEAAAETLPAIGPRTVVWLNETQHYLYTPNGPLGERVAAGLRELLRDPARAPVLVLGTIWPEYWARLTLPPELGRPDEHAQARAMLTGSAIVVPAAFSAAEVTALRSRTALDPRLVQAAERAEHGQVTQYLAGGPALVERYETAPAAAKALIEAAADARRLGHGPALSHAFLEQASPGYLTDQQWDEVGEDWLEQALAYTAAPCRGARGPLTRIRPQPGQPAPEQPHYRLADYLEQYSRRSRRFKVPPRAFWDAALLHARTVDDVMALGRAARDRWRNRHAARLYNRAADTGNVKALRALVSMREAIGDNAEAERLATRAADTDGGAILRDLARARVAEKDSVAVEGLLRMAIAAGNVRALRDLTLMRERAGDKEEAERLAVRAAEAGDSWSLLALAWLRATADDHTESARLAHLAAEAGNTLAVLDLSEFQPEPLDPTEAERLYSHAAAAKERLAPRPVDAGDVLALRQKFRKGKKNPRKSAHYPSSDPASAVPRKPRAPRVSSPTDAEADAYRRTAEDGDPRAMWNLGRVRERAGDRSDAERLYRQAADVGYVMAIRDLARLRDAVGDHADAQRLARLAADAGDSKALVDMAKARPNDLRWQQIIRYGLEADGSTSTRW